MKSVWLNKENNDNLIIFFSGWGSDELIFKNLSALGYDVIMFYDYENFEYLLPDFSSYAKKYIIAWSLGVYVVNNFFEENEKFDKIVAINGTQNPIDDEYGIPSKIYQLTVDNFNEVSCKKFMSKISSNNIFKNYKPRTTAELKNELVSVQNLKVQNYLKFDKAYISLNDKIIPPKNQINYWENNKTEIIKLDASHYIFDLYSSWDEFL